MLATFTNIFLWMCIIEMSKYWKTKPYIFIQFCHHSFSSQIFFFLIKVAQSMGNICQCVIYCATRTVWTRTTRLAAWGRSRSPPASWPVSSPSCCRRRWAGAQWSARLRSATSSRRPYWGDSTCGTQMIQCVLWPNGLTSSDSPIKYVKSWQDFCKVLFEVKKES